MEIQWYPGHMTKARRQMQEDMKLIDLVIELADARIPMSSRNPDIDSLSRNKARMILLNKEDLADPEATAQWMTYFRQQGYFVVPLDSRNRKSMKEVQNAIDQACARKIQRDLARGIKNRPVRAMVAGIPNVGKSTFINSFAGKAAAKTGNRPGVTKGKQWIRLNKNVELLDTPGLLWPKFEDPHVGLCLAFIGSVKDELLQKEELAMELCKVLLEKYPGCLGARYGIAETKDLPGILTEVAQKRNCLIRGQELDYNKAAGLIMDDFRSGMLGRITLELPE
jgi:ribosome biogenesis GTPase A